MNQLVEIGVRLRAERDRLGLSQAALGLAVGVTNKTQSLYEKGERAPDAAYLSAVAALGMDVQFVLTGTPGAPATPQLIDDGNPFFTILTPEALAEFDNQAPSIPTFVVPPQIGDFVLVGSVVLRVLFQLHAATESGVMGATLCLGLTEEEPLAAFRDVQNFVRGK
ncbi:helix-turn-helix domain-containing protein [Chitiniphilus shinanonensis]|uniref:helix-turn-helix domain-containing protein n=1 Tax=Chitiniphilus shinanonensis TaxID=553088 RepID=UPI003028EE26